MATRVPVPVALPLPTREQWNAWCLQQQQANPQFVPPVQVCLEDIDDWKAASAAVAHSKAREGLLRQKLFKFFFPSPREGTNNLMLQDGRKFVAKHVITREVDETGLDTLRRALLGDMRAQLTTLGLDVSGFTDDAPVTEVLKLSMDKLIKSKPSLVTTEYRTLTDEQRIIFETALAIKDGSPQLTLEPPKEAE